MHVAVSEDEGATWRESTLGDDAPGASASISPRLAADDSGRLGVAWLDARGGDYSPWFATLAGSAWSDAIPLDDPVDDTTASTDLSLAATGQGRWFAAWREAPSADDLLGRLLTADIAL